MSFGESLARQLARPQGAVGRLLGEVMDLANRRPTRLAVDLLDPQPGDAILDAGCGTGAAMAEVLKRCGCRVVGVDRSGTMVRRAERRLRTLGKLGSGEVHHGDIASLPFFPAAFSGVLALNVLYFCDAEARMVAELKTALRPGGRLVAYVTERAAMERWAIARAGTHRLYDKAELAALLIQGGFAANRITIHRKQISHKHYGLLAYAEA